MAGSRASHSGLLYDVCYRPQPNTLDVGIWHDIADLVWQGKTCPQAARELGLDWMSVYRQMDLQKRRFMVDTSMLAGVRYEILSESHGG